MKKKVVKTSKLLSFLLRHDPGAIGLALDAAGWADVKTLVRLARAAGHAIDENLVRDAVASNDKKRFSLSPDHRRIRARQGHSFPVELGLEATAPPKVLFHGTATRFLGSIFEEGLVKGDRMHVHLSADARTARQVGGRHGKPVVLEVAAGRMAASGHAFYLSENGVWLVDRVPPEFLSSFPG